MQHSNIPNSVIAKYSRILTGIIFTATSILPLATSAIAQSSNPTLTITGITRTHVIPAQSEVVYRIKVTNTTAVPAYKVKITDVLPTGFSYGKHLTTLQKGAVLFGSATKFLDTAAANKPAVGANTLAWDNITIPANGSIEFIFTATASAAASTIPYSMPSLKVDYYQAAAGTSIITANADLSGTADDVTLKSIPPTATLTIAPTTTTTIDETICALPGIDGIAANITGIVNTYFKPTLQSVGVGTANTQSIPIAAGAAKGATQDIKPGDLVLIVQMQDASINSSNTEAYGSGSTSNQGSGQISMGSSGLYEYAIANSTVLAASGNATLTLKKTLLNTYTSAAKTTTSGQKRFQVVRVPQYASAKILGTMFASPWDGNVGGILAVDTFGNFDLNGQRLSVNEAGFRGGFGLKNGNIAAQEGFVANTNVYGMDSSGNILINSDNSPQSIVTQNTLGSGKGEGVAGTPRFISTKSLNNVDPIDGSPVWSGGFSDNKIEGYPGGDTGRGAPANAGGGADAHNAGGGGGGNGGNGGQGSLGYGYNNALKDAGGRPGSSSLINIPTPTKVFMGGGGGGGETNDSPQGVPGGAGGGIVMLRAGTIVGSGSIYANGANGDRGAFGANPDGGGGGGAGGTVLIQSRNSTSANIAIQAKGGNGGNTERDSFYDYATTPVTNPANQTNSNGYSPDGYVYPHAGRTPHGPGGGGAGGIVLHNVTSAATITPAVTGGSNGHTDDPSPSTTLTNSGGVLLSTLGSKTSHSNGATAGSSGQIVAFTGGEDRFTDLNNKTSCSPNLSMTMTTSTPERTPGQLVSYKMTVTNTASIGQATTVSLQNRLPSGFTYSTTNSIDLNGGAVPAIRPTSPAQVNPPIPPTTGTPTAAVLAQLKKPVWGTFTIPPGGKVEINFQALISANVGNGIYHDKADAIYPDPARTTTTQLITNSYGEDATQKAADVKVTNSTVEMVWNFLKDAVNWSK
jgi:uncharacterized repeat protein (TIGR01451 family)